MVIRVTCGGGERTTHFIGSKTGDFAYFFDNPVHCGERPKPWVFVQ
jgi:hypothetical protein